MVRVGAIKARKMVQAGEATFAYQPRHEEMNRALVFDIPGAAQSALDTFCAKYGLEGGSVATLLKVRSTGLEMVADNQGHCRQLFARVSRVGHLEVAA